MWGNRGLYNSNGNKKKQIGTWSKLVALCTKTMGGYYRSNGTIVRNIATGNTNDDDEAIFVETDVEFAEKMLNEAEVALVPGSAFGTPGHMRISFATSDENLQKAVALLTAALA